MTRFVGWHVGEVRALETPVLTLVAAVALAVGYLLGAIPSAALAARLRGRHGSSRSAPATWAR
jgi:hypothetical protein